MYGATLIGSSLNCFCMKRLGNKYYLVKIFDLPLDLVQEGHIKLALSFFRGIFKQMVPLRNLLISRQGQQRIVEAPVAIDALSLTEEEDSSRKEAESEEEEEEEEEESDVSTEYEEESDDDEDNSSSGGSAGGRGAGDGPISSSFPPASSAPTSSSSSKRNQNTTYSSSPTEHSMALLSVNPIEDVSLAAAVNLPPTLSEFIVKKIISKVSAQMLLCFRCVSVI